MHSFSSADSNCSSHNQFATARPADSSVCLCVQTPAQAGEPSTYWSQKMRMMPLASIDPSLAIGFYCRTLGMPACCLYPYQLGLAVQLLSVMAMIAHACV